MRFGHVGLTVSNLDLSIKAYEEAFGFALQARMTRDAPWIGKIVGYDDAILEFAHLKRPCGFHLELIRYHRPLPSYAHLTPWFVGTQHFQMTTEHIEAALSPALAAGFKMRGSLTRIPEGPNTGAKCCYLAGPDNETVELFEGAA